MGTVTVGTWVVDGVNNGVEKGYILVRVFTFCEYTAEQHSDNSGGLRTEYVNMFLKLKQEAYSNPGWVQTEPDKGKYIEQHRIDEGAVLDTDNTAKNPGEHTLAEVKRNSTWGKWGENKNKTQATLTETAKGSKTSCQSFKPYVSE
jgi:hypothetical protein